MRQNKTGENKQAYIIVHDETCSFMLKCNTPEYVNPKYLHFEKRKPSSRTSRKHIRRIMKEKICRAA